jgi:hypothetical protein
MSVRTQMRCFALVAAVVLAPIAVTAAESQWVRLGSDGKLIYKATPAGDRIMDFSYAGYMGGGVALPNVPVKKAVRPSGSDDDTAEIQKAIHEVAALPMENGFHGAVLLAPGVFICSNTLTIAASGVVLRGSGSAVDLTRTTLKLVGKPHNAITIRGGADERGPEANAATQSIQTKIADAYVPSGTNRFAVDDPNGFAVGDTIEIRRPVTPAWIKFMQMDDLVRDGKPQTWLPAGNSTAAERRIAAISGNTITVDVPLSDSFDSKYLNPPGTAVLKIRPPASVSQVGVENLHIECPPQEINHTQPHFTALRINAEDAWVRDVVIDETMNSVGINGRRITLQRLAVNRKARHQGSSKPAEFAPNASQVLLDHCTSTSDNVWYAATGGGVSGPIVLLQCTFLGDGRVEAHQRWSTGMLYDNCRVPGGGMDFKNRGSMGSGHGWTMGWGVAWNCEAKDFVIQNPPGAVNWMIGCIGESKLMPRPFGKEPNLAEGIKDSHGAHVSPKSLYLAQLRERLGAQALQNIGAADEQE